MICNKCGSDEPDYALYCTKCGAKLEPEAPAIPFEAAAAPQSDSGASPFAGQTGTSSPYAGQTSTSSPYAGQTDAGSPYTGYSGAAGASDNGFAGGAPSSPSNNDWMAVVALVCGIASLPCCFTCWGGALLGAAGVVFGILGLKTAKSSYAIAGIVCGAIGLLMSLLVIVLAAGAYTMFDMPSEIEDVFDNLPIPDGIDF